jgi:hypothetical protein
VAKTKPLDSVPNRMEQGDSEAATMSTGHGGFRPWINEQDAEKGQRTPPAIPREFGLTRDQGENDSLWPIMLSLSSSVSRAQNLGKGLIVLVQINRKLPTD